MAAKPSVARLLRVLLFCSPLLLVSPHALAQTVTGGLQFSVADSTGSPLDGVIASVTGPEIQGVRNALSDRLGRCTIPVLPPGIVSLRLTHPGYQATVVENIRIQLSRTTALGTVVLQQSVYDLPEVVVSSERAYIDANSSTYGSNLRPIELDALPMDRDYRDMVSMLPQSNLSYFGDGVNIGGATGAENKNVVDGVEVTDPLIQGSGTVLPYNFIREVEVKAGGYEADTRGTLGGVLNVVTYSGTNELHGSAFGFYTSNRFSADPQLGLSDPTQGEFSNDDVGFSLGGPILPDRLWFFVAYNPTFERRDVNVPSFGISVDQTLIHSFAAKLTWAAAERLNIVFTATGDPSKRDAVGNGVGTPPAGLTTPDSYLMDIGWGGTNFSLNGTYMPSNDILIEASMARVNRHDTGQPATEFGEQEPFYVDYRTDIWSGGPSGSWDSFRYATMGRLAASLTLGGHTLRAGGEYKVNGTDNRYDYDQIYRYDTTYYERYVGKGYQTIHDNIPSIFIHDTWQVTEELSLYGGVRWDGQEIIASDGSLARRSPSHCSQESALRSCRTQSVSTRSLDRSAATRRSSPCSRRWFSPTRGTTQAICITTIRASRLLSTRLCGTRLSPFRQVWKGCVDSILTRSVWGTSMRWTTRFACGSRACTGPSARRSMTRTSLPRSGGCSGIRGGGTCPNGPGPGVSTWRWS